MNENQSILQTDSGRQLRKGKQIGLGGQAIINEATDLRSGEVGVIKIFNAGFDRSVLAQRIRFLINLKLGSRCSALVAPTDSITTPDRVGHYSRFVPGHNLSAEFENPSFDFYQGLQIALCVARLVEAVHSAGIAHGDINSGNFCLVRKGDHFEVCAIDFDNYVATGALDPFMIGHKAYMSPGLRQAAELKQHALPTVQSDRYSLAVILHELLLHCHPGLAKGDTKEGLKQTMADWFYDPLYFGRHGRLDGHRSPFVLDEALCRLFRRGISHHVRERPSATEWVVALSSALGRVDLCDVCGYPSILDSSKIDCPVDRHAYPALKLVVGSTGKTIAISKKQVDVGRDDLCGSPNVSRHHATVRRLGPAVLLESVGLNGTCRWNGSDWLKIPDDRPVLVRENEWLRFADVQVMVTR